MKSLYGKFMVITVVIMIVSGLIAFLSVNTYYHQKLKVENDEKNMGIVKSIAGFIDSTDDLDLESYLETQSAVGYKLYVVNEQMKETSYGAPFRVDNLSQEAVNQVLAGKPYHGMRDLPGETFVTGFFSDELSNSVGIAFTYDGQTQALFLRPDIKMLFSEVHVILAVMVLIMAILSMIAMMILAKKLIDPITELTTATKKVGEEKDFGSLPINRKDEIGQLAQSFQQMTVKLSENDRIRKEFISDVSHDFQSPLLNIKGYAELLFDNELSDGQRKSYALVIQTETERLSSLSQQLLLLTSLDQLSSPLERTKFSLDEQLKDTIRKYRWLLEEKSLTLSMDLDEVAFIGDPAFLEKVWENLLSNALKYTPDEGTIEIGLVDKSSSVVVTVHDNGIGINKKEIERIFDRFYRADDSRTHKTSGTGLGLSIVQQVVKLHSGAIEVTSNNEGGSTFTVTLPKL